MVHYSNYLNLSETPKAKAGEIGARLKQLRLNKDITQSDVAEATGLERRIILNAEKGSVTLVNFIAILDFFGAMSTIDSFLPKQPISPVQLSKLQGRQRLRASGEHSKSEDTLPKGSLANEEDSKEELGW